MTRAGVRQHTTAENSVYISRLPSSTIKRRRTHSQSLDLLRPQLILLHPYPRDPPPERRVARGHVRVAELPLVLLDLREALVEQLGRDAWSEFESDLVLL